MANPRVGFKGGERIIVWMLLDKDAGTVSNDDPVTYASATSGYVLKASAGDIPCGVAIETKTAGTADGDVRIAVDVSPDTIYTYAPDAGSVTQALVGKTMDFGGSQTINIDASTDDCVRCVGVDTANNLLDVQFLTSLADAGVV